MRQVLRSFDYILTKYITSWPSWVRMPFHVITFIGRPVITMGICFLICLMAIVYMNAQLFLAAIVAMATMIFGTLIKIIIQRARPSTEYVMKMFFQSSSFPSGHTLGSTIGFGFLAYVASVYLSSPWSVIIVVFLTGLIIMVGISRVYLGAHHPSDVLVGWIVGCVGLATIIFMIKPSL